MASVVENLSSIRTRIEQACKKSGRNPSEITLVAVTKYQNEEKVREAASAGLKIFGESRIQQAKDRILKLSDLNASWHLIGHLQSNKAKLAVQLFDLIESVDSLKLATDLSRHAIEQGKSLQVYGQVNISGEEQKHGFDIAAAFKDLKELAALENIELKGLMGMAAAADSPEAARSSFAALKQLARDLESDLGRLVVSMGMSDDFEVAIEEGADVIRVGSALFA